MESFQHVMALVSVVIGLAIAHILSALGQAIQRFMGSGRSIRLDLAFLFWIGFMFIYLVGFWWWEYRFSEIEQWTMGLYLFVLGYAVLLFLVTVILVPFQMEGVDDTRQHFYSVRRWFFGLLLAVNLVDFIDTFLKGVDWGLRISYLAFFVALTVVCVAGLISRSTKLHIAMAFLMFSWQIVYIFQDLGVLVPA